MKKICKNCKYWGGDSMWYDEYFDTAPCHKLLGELEIVAGYIGADRVRTKSDFGCVHFEPKDNND